MHLNGSCPKELTVYTAWSQWEGVEQSSKENNMVAASSRVRLLLFVWAYLGASYQNSVPGAGFEHIPLN